MDFKPSPCGAFPSENRGWTQAGSRQALFQFDKLILVIIRNSCANLLSHHSGPWNLPF